MDRSCCCWWAMEIHCSLALTMKNQKVHPFKFWDRDKQQYSEESLIVLMKIFPGRCKELHFVIHVFLLAVGTPKTSQKIGGACSPQKKFMLRISFSFFFCVKLYVVIRPRKIKQVRKSGLTPQNMCVILVVFETVWKNLRN